jgi:hypothetical protein
MPVTIKLARRSSFYVSMSVVFLVIALVGFSTTYFIPLASGTFRAPLVVHVHGVLLLGWLLMLIAQATLIRERQIPTHRRLGWIGASLAAGIVISGVAIGLHVTRRDLVAIGADPFVFGQFVNILIEMLLFGGLVAVAVALRRDGESHKRLLLLATISALAPAWLRMRHLLPMVPNPFVTFSVAADSLVLVAMARDWIVLKRIHSIYIWAGGGMILVHLIELAAIESDLWQRIARWLLGEI